MNDCSNQLRAAEGPLCHYVVVRRDLPRGLQLVQAVHAAGESSPGDLKSGTHAVVLEARDSVHLAEIAQNLTNHEVAHVPIIENDSPYQDQLLAIGVQPGPKAIVGRWLSSLPLVREKAPMRSSAALPTPMPYEGIGRIRMALRRAGEVIKGVTKRLWMR